MPNTRRHSYDLNFKLKIVGEAEAVNNNREIAREYGISESMVRKWRNQQHVLFRGKLKMTAKRASMGRYRPKDPELDQQLADWFSDQRSRRSRRRNWQRVRNGKRRRWWRIAEQSWPVTKWFFWEPPRFFSEPQIWKSQWPAIFVLCLRYLEYLSPFIWEIWQILYFVARIYSAIRRTPSLDQISIEQAHFLQKNAAPYNRKNTVCDHGVHE